MKINKIKVKNPEMLTAKSNLTEEEYSALEIALSALINAHNFLEFDKDISAENYLKRIHTPDFTGVRPFVQPYGVYILEDYLIHSAYMTEQGNIIINAYPIWSSSISELLSKHKQQHFLVSGIDATCVSASTYDCFVSDASVPTVEL